MPKINLLKKIQEFLFRGSKVNSVAAAATASASDASKTVAGDNSPSPAQQAHIANNAAAAATLVGIQKGEQAGVATASKVAVDLVADTAVTNASHGKATATSRLRDIGKNYQAQLKAVFEKLMAKSLAARQKIKVNRHGSALDVKARLRVLNAGRSALGTASAFAKLLNKLPAKQAQSLSQKMTSAIAKRKENSSKRRQLLRETAKALSNPVARAAYRSDIKKLAQEHSKQIKSIMAALQSKDISLQDFKNSLKDHKLAFKSGKQKTRQNVIKLTSSPGQPTAEQIKQESIQTLKRSLKSSNESLAKTIRDVRSKEVDSDFSRFFIEQATKRSKGEQDTALDGFTQKAALIALEKAQKTTVPNESLNSLTSRLEKAAQGSHASRQLNSKRSGRMSI